MKNNIKYIIFIVGLLLGSLLTFSQVGAFGNCKTYTFAAQVKGISSLQTMEGMACKKGSKWIIQ